jgi:AraC-like DNA-binding protein
MKAVGDPSFPLRAAAAFQLEDSEVFGFLAISCATLGQAYERTAAYRGLYNVGARWDLLLTSDASRLVWQPWAGEPDDPAYRAAMDYAVADMANSICRLGRTRPRPKQVKLKHAAPERTGPFDKFYGAEVAFGADCYELVYEAGLSELPIETFNSKLRDYFDEACRQLVGKFDAAAGVTERVRRNLIASMDGGDTAIEKAAKQVGMSTRSLQRRLADEGTTYNEVLSDVREEFAKRYLARGNVSASEVAFLLGFTEPPAFFKAFKRWTGMTPRAFQQRSVAQ